MVEGGDVCESTIMKEKNLQRNMGLMEGQDTKLANLKPDIVLALKYLEQTIVWKLKLADWPSKWCLISEQTHSHHKAWVINPLLIEIVCYIIKSILHMKGQQTIHCISL